MINGSEFAAGLPAAGLASMTFAGDRKSKLKVCLELTS